MQFHPLHNLILVHPIRLKQAVVSKIILPESAKSRTALVIAKVVEVGDGKQLEDGSRLTIDLKPGDYAAFPRGCPVYSIESNEMVSADEDGERYELPKACLVNYGHLVAKVDVQESDIDDSPQDEPMHLRPISEILVPR